MNKLLLSLILSSALVLLFQFSSVGQASIQNLSTIQVENLSDDQIVQLLDQAQGQGFSDGEIIRQAKVRGLPESEAKKLQIRINAIRQKIIGRNSSTSVRDTVNNDRRLNYESDIVDSAYSVKKLFEALKPRIFGAEIFANKGTKFEANLRIATPVNYIIGPSDQLNINVFGKSVVNWKLDVSPEGNINIPGVGILNVSGKTLDVVTAIIKSKLRSYNYSIGQGTNVSVTLGNIRSIQIIVIGQVLKPGTYTLPSLATVFNALYASGGPNESGSFRQIEIIRNNRIIRKLDVYDFLSKGSQKDNISLQDQDVIRVPTYRTRVELSGQIKIPALFEVLPGETLHDVINYAGGFSDSAYTARIKVSQIIDQQRRITDVVEADYKNYIPLKGDKYIVEPIIDRYENRVTITGAIYKPGEYELTEGLNLRKLIESAAGLKEEAFTDRATIVRLKSDNSTEILGFNVRDVINSSVDIKLQREDVVHISSIFDLRDKYVITINGNVRKPGQFAYSENMRVEDLILLAGGFAEGASTQRIEVARRVSDSNPVSISGSVAQVYSVNVSIPLKSNEVGFTLSPFDIVSVYSLPGYEKQRTVKIEGEVIYPGSYTIKTKNEKVSDLVKRAGGLTASADVQGGSLRRINTAILGIDESRADTAELLKERSEKYDRLNKNYRDTTEISKQNRNNFVGINLGQILKSPGSKTDLLLEDGDVLRVPKQQQIVRVNGMVLYPSAVVFEKNKSFSDFVSNAGGYAPGAMKRGGYVVYANGTVKGTRRFLFFNIHPKISPGSEIFVPKKPESKGNALQNVLGITTGIASLGAILLGILSLNK